MGKHYLGRLSELEHLQCKSCTITTTPSAAAGHATTSLLDLFMVRMDDRIYAYENHCPHTGSPLDWMPDQFLDIDKQFIQCATHHALFRIEDGFCIQGPCSGAYLRSLKVIQEGDQLFLNLSTE